VTGIKAEGRKEVVYTFTDELEDVKVEAMPREDDVKVEGGAGGIGVEVAVVDGPLAKVEVGYEEGPLVKLEPGVVGGA
jgi:hypothetical protein